MSRQASLCRNLTKTLLGMRSNELRSHRTNRKDIILAMKLTFLLLTIAFLNVHAHTAAQSVTFTGKNISLQAVFKVIKKQTGYVVFTSTNVLAGTQPVSLSVSNMPLAEFLTMVLKDQPLNYQIEDKTILLSRKPQVNAPIGVPKPLAPPPIEIKGKITDQHGAVIPGVSILIKGTKKGTTTDDNGNFSLRTDDDNSTLIISYTGYKTQEIRLNHLTTIDVRMEIEVNALNDIVVVGYGTQSRSTVSGAITKVGAKEIALSPSPNLGAGLAGRISGVTINNRGGEPGNESLEIFIRGKSTTGDASPLYVIDGIVRDYGALSYLPPSEIESISVLKDASAAIYGSRAANGVILVTTKRGRTGKALITAAFNQAFTQQERIGKVADAYNFALMSNLEQSQKGLPEPYTATDLELYKNGKDPLNHPNTSWQKLVFRPWSNQQRADISISGGNQDVKYFVAAGYLTQNSPFRNSFTYDKQYHFRSNIDAQIAKNLKISLDLSGRKRDNVASHMDWAHVYLSIPTQNGIYPNGLYGPGRTGNNAALMARERDYGYTLGNAANFTSNLSIDYKIAPVPGLSIQANLAYDYDNNYLKNFQGVTYYYLLDPATGIYNKMQNSNAASPSLNIDYPNGNSMTTNIKLSYKRMIIPGSTIDAFIGFEQNQTASYSVSAGRTNYASSSIQELFAGDANKANQSNNGSSASTGRQNLFGRALYSYLDKYSLQFQFRYDGSQNFPVGKRYGFFPGVSGAWNISKENFLSQVRSLDYLKLRASYGELGNDKIGPYQYLTSYSYGNNYAFNGITNQGLVQTNAPNPNITWEVAKTVDIGLEGSIFGGLLTAELDLFSTNRSNILAKRNASVPSYTGLTLPSENIGRTKNKGVELSLTHTRTINKNFKYAVEGNFTYAKNTVVFIDEVPGSPDYQRAQGKSIGTPVLYEVIGVYKDQTQIDASPHLAGISPGDLIRKDINGDKIINNLDQVRQDYSTTPQIVYGLNFRVDYRQFQLSFGFQGQARALGERYSVLPFDPIGWGNFPASLAKDVWSPENINGNTPKPGQDFGKGGNGTTFNYASAAFLKLKTAELGYNFSNKLLTSAGFKSARIFASGTNLFFIHDNFKDQGVSPEQTNWGWGFGQQRVINLGLNVTF